MKTKVTFSPPRRLLPLTSAPASAEATSYKQTPVADQGGLYLGALGGYEWTDTNVGGASNVDGWDWGLFAGYQMTGLMHDMGWDMTAAVEVEYSWSGADDSGGGMFIDKNHEWGVDFRPGLAFLSSDRLNINPYGIIGYRHANFDNNVVGADSGFNGFELGIGTELVTDGHFGVRLDYDHVWYGSSAGSIPTRTTCASASPTTSTKI